MFKQAVLAAAVLSALVAAVGSPAATTSTRDVHQADGLVFRYYAGAGLRFQPLLSFAALNKAVSRHDRGRARGLAAALLARAVHEGDALYWQYDFSYDGGPSTWRSGFVQAIAAEALARAGYPAEAAAAFRGLRHSLLIPVAGGSWIREYGFTNQVILNSQLQSVIALDRYAEIAKTDEARLAAASLARAARTLLPRFDLGCWGRYELGGVAADSHYEAYHVELLRELATTHSDPIWRTTYRRWKRCI